MHGMDLDSGTLSEHEAKQVLADAGIPVVEEQLAADVDEAVQFADRVGYPVILKVDSRDIQHKSDIGAVTDAHDADEVRKRYDILMENVDDHAPDADVNGVLVGEMLSGRELIVGVNTDPDFGHVIMFGLGGVFVEVLHDVQFRSIPITPYDAEQLIDGMKTRELLDGIRGENPADIDALIDILLDVSALIEDHPEIVELDINPLFANENGVVAADALIRVDK